jgi:arylformamidase
LRRDAIIELSHRMKPGQETFHLGARTFDVTELLPEVTHRPDIWYILGEVIFSTHTGTHIEFPYHHYEPGADAADYPIEALIGDAVVLDFTAKATREAITLDELKAHASRLREGNIVFLRTDNDRLFRTERWDEQPYLEPEAMRWLIDTYHPKVIGTDAAGFEVPGTDYQPNHLTMFEHGIAMVESATNLAAVGDERVMCFILPLPIEGIDACPVRIVAFRKEDLRDAL